MQEQEQEQQSQHRTWLDALPLHAVFSTASSSSSRHDAEPLPPSPNLTGIVDTRNRGGRRNSDNNAFPLLAQSTSSSSSATTTIAAASPSSSRRHNVLCNIRKTELLVAAGHQLRLCNLAHFKAKIESHSAGGAAHSSSINTAYDASWLSDATWDNNQFIAGGGGGSSSSSSSNSLGNFKTLYTPAVDFEILSLIPSPSNRYVAVVGRSQIVVVQVPRKGWDGLVARSLECSHDPIGPFYHSPSSPQISQVSFHPWGKDESVLLVLTEDGLLREYDVSDDPEEPTQIVDFASPNQTGTVLPESAALYRGTRYGLKSSSRSRLDAASGRHTQHRARSRSRSRSRSVSRATPGAYDRPSGKKRAFGVSNDDEAVPVSFCLGEGQEDWSPFALYCLMKSGDLYCVCPYLPKRAQVPVYLLETLSSLAAARLEHLSDGHSSAGLSLYEKRELEGECNAQAKFVEDLLSQSGRRKIGQSSTDLDDAYDPEQDVMDVHYPSYLRNPPARQGPFLFQPAPEELHPDELAPSACDVLYLKTGVQASSNAHDTSDRTTPAGLGFILIANDDGRIDICLDTARVEATWTRSDEDDKDLPSLLVYESVDLYGENAIDADDDRPVRLLRDPEYFDTIHAYHALGVHSISLQAIFAAISNHQDSGGDALNEVLDPANQADVTWLLKQSLSGPLEGSAEDPIMGLAIINDVFLGYAAIAVHADMRVLGMELAYRAQRNSDEDIDATDMDIQSPDIEDRQIGAPPTKAYTPFGDSSSLSLPELLSTRNSPKRISARFAAPPPSSSRGTRASREARPTIDLTIESLKFLGSTVESLDKAIRELIHAGNAVQDRLGMQLSEIPKQVDKLQDVDGKLGQHASDLGIRTSSRLDKIKQSQHDLTTRADRILQRLMDASQPDLSVHEREWIGELERVQRATGQSTSGASTGGKTTMALRAERLREQIAVLRPSLDRLREGVPSQQSSTTPKRLGESQRKGIENALADESRMISEIKTKLETLQKKATTALRVV